jgi:hypothetical protein
MIVLLGTHLCIQALLRDIVRRHDMLMRPVLDALKVSTSIQGICADRNSIVVLLLHKIWSNISSAHQIDSEYL